jgi:hypothetical protein
LISDEKPHAVFIGGDIMPSALMLKQSITDAYTDFVEGFLTHGFLKLRESLGKSYPRIFLILGNDDGKFIEPEILQWEAKGIWEYIHFKKVTLGDFCLQLCICSSYSFRMKDWEKYDVSGTPTPAVFRLKKVFIPLMFNKTELNTHKLKMILR